MRAMHNRLRCNIAMARTFHR